jgi:uncharacterized protein (UPF0332 family)
MPEENNKEFYGKVLQQFMDLFILPEIKKREQAGALQTPFTLTAAQIVFFPDGPKPQVRLNCEIKAIGRMKLKAGVAKKAGEPILENEVEGLENIELSDESEADCGHATLVQLHGHWTIAFDFRYNKGLAKKHIATAYQFLEAAKFSSGQENWSAFVDNLFNCCELLAKATLLFLPDPKFVNKTTHKLIQMRFNRFADIGNVKVEYKKALNKLSGMRDKARYLKGNLSLSADEAHILVTVVEEMFKTLNKQI